MWRLILEMPGEGPTTDEEIDELTEPVSNALDKAGVFYKSIYVDE